MPNSAPTVGPSEEVIAAWAPWMESVPATPWRLPAATSSMAMFTVPATAIEATTSQRVARSRRDRSSARGRCRSRARAEWT